ncbi:conserved Plasmodium protein, unknown function [Plasmodium berghei]|uniref:Uncharacterized protein n=2 Tax=Plasmodium berghei TaxID=5821 RepID=A0A509AEY0_PLABA|nr:conserved Plasmodium protein, unknown function [Plasmodium berghei ANKA]CXI10451.1 conserved Plasmodium protein, unknown function [Plasmodium berghei]SCL93020.1 conserved Plasmodium protein, unknown function [Plasmodium berghei]SCM15772.1 conserved Plasmodium protein, unknown function [Plasmodium berghei]SCM17567.1 conserved Plasmodium protein, unknown function [Plasmodium berghei]SCN23022.1 conserved Plasmodium protein, unknown function [Plasmodium berghei]|eukprot:XP_034420378.1 conserved Plasmodium protein, unknown function [Plasmodium berghei ANKA]
MKKYFLLKYAILFYFLIFPILIYVGSEENNQSKIDNLNENSRLAFFLLIQLKVPYLLEKFTQSIKYEKVIDAIIYLYNEELAKPDVVKKQNSYSIQDIKNVVQGLQNIRADIKNGDTKYFNWMNLIYKECWNDENYCHMLTSEKCSLAVFKTLPSSKLPITCISCMIYAMNYALHSEYLFKVFSSIVVCNKADNLKLLSLSNDIGLIREYRIYLNFLNKNELLKNIQSEIIILNIKNSSRLINLLTNNMEENNKINVTFRNIINESMSEIIKNGINRYIKYLNNNHLYTINENNDINIELEKAVTVTINGYLYLDKKSNKLLHVQDFGLFFPKFYFKKCINLLTSHNLFVQIEFGINHVHNFAQIKNLFNFIELELILNSYFHLGNGYYSSTSIILKKFIYMNNQNVTFNEKDNNIYIYNEFNKDKYNVDNLLFFEDEIIGSKEDDDFQKNNSNNIHNLDILNSFEEKYADNIKLNPFDDKTIILILMVKILTETKITVIKEKIISLLIKPVYSKSLDGFEYKEHKLIQNELVDILGESYSNSNNYFKRRTFGFGSKINKKDIEELEKITPIGYKLIQIAFKSYNFISINDRKNIYSGSQMFSLFQNRLHYLNNWDAKILFIKKIESQNIIEKKYNVYSYPEEGCNNWLVTCCIIIILLIILLSFILYRYVLNDKFNLAQIMKNWKTNKKKKKLKKYSYINYNSYYKYNYSKLGLNKRMRDSRSIDRKELRQLIRKNRKKHSSYYNYKDREAQKTKQHLDKNEDNSSKNFFREEIQTSYQV